MGESSLSAATDYLHRSFFLCLCGFGCAAKDASAALFSHSYDNLRPAFLTDGRPVAPLGGVVLAVLEVLDEHAGEAEGDVVVPGARQDRREALLVGGGEVGAAPQQQLRRLHKAARRSQVQRTNLLMRISGLVRGTRYGAILE